MVLLTRSIKLSSRNLKHSHRSEGLLSAKLTLPKASASAEKRLSLVLVCSSINPCETIAFYTFDTKLVIIYNHSSKTRSRKSSNDIDSIKLLSRNNQSRSRRLENTPGFIDVKLLLESSLKNI